MVMEPASPEDESPTDKPMSPLAPEVDPDLIMILPVLPLKDVPVRRFRGPVAARFVPLLDEMSIDPVPSDDNPECNVREPSFASFIPMWPPLPLLTLNACVL